MDCQTTRLLLAFAHRRVERMDDQEQLALRQHLDTCPDCAALASAETAWDCAIGSAMRSVQVPAGMRERIRARLAAQPRPVPYAWLAAAAALLLAATGAGAGIHYLRQPQLVTLADAEHYYTKGTSENDVKQWFTERHVDMEWPAGFNAECLRDYELVRFMGQDVPKLVFANRASRGDVYVLDRRRFTLDLPEVGTNTFTAREQDGFVCLIHFEGDLGQLQLTGN